MKNTIWIFSIEPIESRYTGHWHKYIPEQLQNDNFEVVQIDGIQKDTIPTPGAFLNFSDTNYWKSSQFCKFLDYYNEGKVQKGDRFLFTDAWNTNILQLKYMNDLLGMNWEIHGMFHAGSWDKEDFLGRLIGNKEWVRNTELAIYNALDYNYFATDFHIQLFGRNLLGWYRVEENEYLSHRIIKTGWPMDYTKDILQPYKSIPKENIIIFPHRIAPEKQVEIFRDLEKHLPQYKFIVCQDQKLSKDEYHTLMAKSKIVFSCSKQETLGLSMGAEGPMLNCIPMSPDRLSYSEIFRNSLEFLYPEIWTSSWENYVLYKECIIEKIKNYMNNYNDYVPYIHRYLNTDYNSYFKSNILVSIITDSI